MPPRTVDSLEQDQGPQGPQSDRAANHLEAEEWNGRTREYGSTMTMAWQQEQFSSLHYIENAGEKICIANGQSTR